jgi:hypothetical protein
MPRTEVRARVAVGIDPSDAGLDVVAERWLERLLADGERAGSSSTFDATAAQPAEAAITTITEVSGIDSEGAAR